jgi:lactaldehyde dehydrogenase/glycolaldehyde dehydrogenase
VHDDIYDEFLDRFVAQVKELRVGDPLDEQTDVGPKVSEEELVKVERMVAGAAKAGAKIVMGGTRPKTPPTPNGYWYSPTIITDAGPGMPIMQDEIFGPVVPIVRFSRFDDAVSVSNKSAYGLSAYIFTRDLQHVMRSVREVDFGELYVNRIGPESLQGFHVGYRQSGLGGDDGSHGLEIYLKKKTVYVNYGATPATTLMPYRAKG